MVDKSKNTKVYYSIGEVAKTFDVSTSLIRFWEKEFSVLRPRKNKKGNRLFTERDMRYFHMIYNLVKVKGYTLQGAKDALKDGFDEIEERVIIINTLNKIKDFLLELDSEMVQKKSKS